jgi:hypothetical protein
LGLPNSNPSALVNNNPMDIPEEETDRQLHQKVITLNEYRYYGFFDACKNKTQYD